MKVAFRVDASLQMGSGHVMRCLTLADALAARGAACVFICRAHPGNLLDLVRSKGHAAQALPVTSASAGASSLEFTAIGDEPVPVHSHWLGATQDEDAEACAPILAELQPDWLIVDHYALDARWELLLRAHCRRLMVIDDLADRAHACDLLLDQTFGRDAKDYQAWVPSNCQMLCGSQYALLRPEFAALRAYSLQRRARPQLRQLLITMGGVDKDNATGQVLMALRVCPLPADCRVTVVMGATAPWLSEVKQLAREMPWPTRVLVGVNDMAQLMADSDLAVGAAGATSWERCCLGLPTIMIVLANNQWQVAQGLEKAGAASVIERRQDIAELLPIHLSALTEPIISLQTMSQLAMPIVEGRGAYLIARLLEA
ncbi:UDP-2,4-diacetamido-2,4,6-trideoxy-beta-L-altropyranose hydrolase [Stutzerimonas stutzeri]|uniref:UDP-2,4-diacetamido-2,4, 6-trideoxy-beta-L-altropyranose hydrolase n=1 Tax=Stutzerimonas stutzeri TaxID=316 RepID=A0A2S4AMR7_STUST|nr:UDP-2,4-diacetamido-2,4,6-trideoxy-beta-L-altropyranose hydrolase [Stutzerimonas stutzeri]MCQ4262832.1 UDP-2,4-diacetamido-2,4,6-trideoxy-beta-L-altropyranose hydrolase [Stutzerimonas stutzeri]MCQ4287307.1 UDP-2,4-diacetamido-2,4,6-trideoxy-beta-L-altropyranose hydrolase [Stutzerimonas stutzeri]POH82654.1 UDP-2,4-diacetamido-2,4,6-trideoxy-beta-L-altropyranose hydrolase [Stutzerimonas stutzeri]